MTDLRGYELLRNAKENKSTAFSKEERDTLGLRGLLPHRTSTEEQQEARVLGNLRRKQSDIEKYIFLRALKERNERLFYRTTIDNMKEIMPLIYTPTVGQACKEFAHIFRQTKGFYITPEDKGHIRTMLDNWPEEEVKVIVITDGQRILGLGDLGANGMGISIGKLALYTACAGIYPKHCLPVMLDIGTNNEELLNDPLYLGYPHKRIEGDPYYALIEEFVSAIKDKFPKALIQFEDFVTTNAYTLLEEYQNKTLCFNDDIQGTAAVALSGIYASTRISNVDFKDLRILFLGAGSAATGIGDLTIDALVSEGLTREEAKKRLWFVDRDGLIVTEREVLPSHKAPYAQDHKALSFMDAIKEFKPHILIGATGIPNTFTKEVFDLMTEINERPTVFALSNPTANAECTAEQAYNWSNGKAIFASGSPFDEVMYEGKVFQPGQGNNAYVFPGIGLGAVAVEASQINQDMFLAASKELANLLSQDELDKGTLYPPLSDIREVSLNIAIAVAEEAYKHGLAGLKKPKNLKEHISSLMYQPNY